MWHQVRSSAVRPARLPSGRRRSSALIAPPLPISESWEVAPTRLASKLAGLGAALLLLAGLPFIAGCQLAQPRHPAAAVRSSPQHSPSASPTPSAPPSAPPSQSPPVPTPVGDVLATASIQDYLAARVGNITAAVYDVDTGRTVEYHPGDAQDTASIEKVAILGTMLDQAQAAGRQLTESEEELAVEMIEASDDEAAEDLWLEVGDAPAIADFDSKVGMTQTVPNVAGYWGLTTTTALDQIRLLMQIAFPSSVLDPGSRAYELGLMTHINSGQDWGISAGPPGGATVALKNGWLPLSAGDWQVNSIGYVNGFGRSYLIAVLTTGDPTEGYGIQTIESISQLVWSQIDRTPASPPAQLRSLSG